MLVLIAALFSFSVAFAETGTETEKEQKNGNKNTTAEGQSYTIDGTYIAGTGSKQASPMTSKGLKFRTAVNGGTLEFTVREGYTITKLYMAAIGNYAADNSDLPYVKVTKVEVDGTEVDFDGGEFPDKNASEAAELTVENISATQKIVLYFDNSNASAGTQLNASWSIDWSRPDATQPTITVTPETVALVPGATYQLNVHVDPNSFTTQWVSSDETVATVDENGLVTAVAAGTATISNQWTDDATVADAAVITVTDFDPSAFTLTAYDFTAMGDVALTKGESAGKIWNAAQSSYTENEVFWCTNEGLENLAIQQYFEEAKTNTGWKIVDGEGLFLGGGAGRCAAIGGIKAGQIVEFIYTGNHFYTTSADAGINKTAISEGVGRAIFVAEEDGMIGFELDKGNYVKQINIYSTPVIDAKAALQDAIAQAILLNTFANDADLANAIAAAQDAVNDAAATMMSLAAAGKALNDAALVAAKSTLQEVVELAESFGIDVTAANAVLNNENASVEDYALVLQNLAEVAKPEIANYIALANKFLETFDKAALAALANDIADFQLIAAGNDFGAIKEAMTALMKKASTYVQADMKKVFTYLGAMEDETLNADIADFQAAVGAYLLGGKNMKAAFTAGIKLAEDFVKAAPTYIEKVQALVAEYKNQGKDVSALETAITDALTALGSEEADIVAKGEAIYNLIQAVEAFKVTVGISEVSVASESAPVFNMAGQRVAAPVKGINIINGKKVIIK